MANWLADINPALSTFSRPKQDRLRRFSYEATNALTGLTAEAFVGFAGAVFKLVEKETNPDNKIYLLDMLAGRAAQLPEGSITQPCRPVFEQLQTLLARPFVAEDLQQKWETRLATIGLHLMIAEKEPRGFLFFDMTLDLLGKNIRTTPYPGYKDLLSLTGQVAAYHLRYVEQDYVRLCTRILTMPEMAMPPRVVDAIFEAKKKRTNLSNTIKEAKKYVYNYNRVLPELYKTAADNLVDIAQWAAVPALRDYATTFFSLDWYRHIGDRRRHQHHPAAKTEIFRMLVTVTKKLHTHSLARSPA